jgi:hypothetical protein
VKDCLFRSAFITGTKSKIINPPEFIRLIKAMPKAQPGP